MTHTSTGEGGGPLPPREARPQAAHNWMRPAVQAGFLLFSVLLGIRRDDSKCTRCGRRDRTCPNRIQVSKTRFVASEECTACFSCLASCPAPHALRFCGPRGAPSVGAPAYAALLLLAVLSVPRLSASLGYGGSNTPGWAYKHLYATIHEIDHPRGPVRGPDFPAAPESIEAVSSDPAA